MTAVRRTSQLCAALAVVLTGIAAAQSTPPRVVVSAGGGAHTGGSDLTDRREFEVNVETATSQTEHPFATGTLFEGGVGVRLWKGLGAGLSVSYAGATSTVQVDARIPHPFRFDAHRAVSGSVGGARRSETGVHAQVLYHLPLHGRLRAIVLAGPSFISARQDLVREIRYDEEFPYDTATFTSADLSRANGSGVGFNVGVDTSWMFSARLGAGALVRLTRASLDLEAPANRRVALDGGGVHVAVGVRALF